MQRRRKGEASIRVGELVHGRAARLSVVGGFLTLSWSLVGLGRAINRSRIAISPRSLSAACFAASLANAFDERWTVC